MIPHHPVMLAEMLEWLRPQDNEVYIDGTFGAGGYSRAILAAADCQVYAIDRDPSTKRFAETLEQEFPGRFVWILGNFADMCSLAAMHGVRRADGVVLDLGVSSMQLDQAERGFSFKKDGPLDMRMGEDGLSAADVVNEASESELADILYYYGEEKAARAIARAIVAERAKAPILRTQQLAAIVRGVLGGKHSKSDPATRSFQALRIHINQEFESIERGLVAAGSLLSPGGRLVVVTFHSLEDRLVKRHYHSRCGRLGEPSRHVPMHAAANEAPHFFLPRPEKKTASEAEINDNPRARSATMRLLMRQQESAL
ncbi:MAG: 16S rRNA (cytosine(1402)-N(4))-methyltransferase RsmH [Alphaproteobacteria bacterium]|nr:16S rRNA (cytosine(1402)-N(4))-methyltransferase RsmH [Alphaproteobacteria bacterium]